MSAKSSPYKNTVRSRVKGTLSWVLSKSSLVEGAGSLKGASLLSEPVVRPKEDPSWGELDMRLSLHYSQRWSENANVSLSGDLNPQSPALVAAELAEHFNSALARVWRDNLMQALIRSGWERPTPRDPAATAAEILSPEYDYATSAPQRRRTRIRLPIDVGAALEHGFRRHAQLRTVHSRVNGGTWPELLELLYLLQWFFPGGVWFLRGNDAYAPELPSTAWMRENRSRLTKISGSDHYERLHRGFVKQRAMEADGSWRWA